jgi:RIO kinase 1
MFRNLRNDAVYRAGRTVLDNEGKAARGSREARAMAKGTDFGQEMRHLSWLGNEFGMLERLHAAGLDVPAPVAVNDNAILMEYFGDEVRAAPALAGVHLEGPDPRRVFDRLLDQIGAMLDQERIHGDLSGHNILYWDGVARIIDFPQAVSPLENPHAYALFARDVARVCGYFARYGIMPNVAQLTTDLWRAHLPDPIPDDLRI